MRHIFKFTSITMILSPVKMADPHSESTTSCIKVIHTTTKTSLNKTLTHPNYIIVLKPLTFTSFILERIVNKVMGNIKYC